MEIFCHFHYFVEYDKTKLEEVKSEILYRYKLEYKNDLHVLLCIYYLWKWHDCMHGFAKFCTLLPCIQSGVDIFFSVFKSLGQFSFLSCPDTCTS